jgi:hypothetical protein
MAANFCARRSIAVTFLVFCGLLVAVHELVRPPAKASAVVGPVVAQAVACLMKMFNTINTAVLIPTSYEIARNLDGDGFQSGVFIGVSALGTLFGSLSVNLCFEGFGHSTKRKLVVAFLLFCSATDIVMYYAMSLQVFTSASKKGILVALQILTGFFSVVSLVLQEMIATRMTASSYLGLAEMFKAAARNIGFVLGPSIVVATFWLVPPVACDELGSGHIGLERSMLPLLPLGIMFAFFAVLTALSTQVEEAGSKDKSLEETLEASSLNTEGQQDVEQTSTVEDSPRQERKGPQETLYPEQKPSIVALSLVYFFERVCSCVALEVATAQILQLQYSWNPSVVGTGLSCAGLSAAIACISISFLLRFGGIDPLNVAMVLSATACVAAVFLFNFPWSSPGILIAADCVLYTGQVVTGGIMASIAIQNTLPSGPYSMESWITNVQVLAAVAVLAGPALARGLLEVGGRNAYAATQMLTLFLSMFTCGKISALVARTDPVKRAEVQLMVANVDCEETK